MNNKNTTDALRLVREALAKYTETPAQAIQMDTVLVDIEIDSLTLAELLFELEDRLGVTIEETKELPRLVGELVAMVEPHLPIADGANPSS
jgi:acyl carrier protein